MGKRIAVKIGTSSLTQKNGGIDRDKLTSVVSQAASLINDGHSVILISSGAIAAGFSSLGYATRPTTIAGKQAAASVGQGLLMEEYNRAFSEYGIVCAQILLTRDDFTDRRRYKNAFSALELLIKNGAVPVINENDTVAIEEIKLGDNDTLAAQVAAMLHADTLIMLTDIDGMYDKNPREYPDARRIKEVAHITEEMERAAGGKGSSNGTGGMITKLKGARLATHAGVTVVICSAAEDNVLQRVVGGEELGTVFLPQRSIKTKLQWMEFYAKPAGKLYIDRGAADALILKGKSLLSPGIKEVEGDFAPGDVVDICLIDDRGCIGRGITLYPASRISDAISESGHECGREVIHQDNMVIFGDS